MDKPNVKKSKSINILQIAATDKENLTSRKQDKKINSTKTTTAKRNKNNVELSNRIKLRSRTATSQLATDNCSKRDEFTQTGSILDTDLIVDNPSVNYWQNLAESQKRALESTLKENLDLQKKINELMYENSCLKTMLSEARSLVEVLTEMIEENPEESNEPANEGNNTLDETRGSMSDSDVDDTSLQQC